MTVDDLERPGVRSRPRRWWAAVGAGPLLVGLVGTSRAGRPLDTGSRSGFTVVGALATAGAITALVMLRPTLWPAAAPTRFGPP